jgi:hypothetical protein
MPRATPATAAAAPLLAVLLAAASGGCAALRGRAVAPALPEMATDRPDFTESASVVPAGHVQIETGYTFTRDGDGPETRREHGYPEALVRIGVTNRVEARVGQSFLTARWREGGARWSSRTGAEDLYLGAKVHLTGERGNRPAMVLIAQATVPTGNAGFGAGRLLPGLNWIYAWDLVPDRVSLSASTQGNLAVDAADARYLELTQSASVGYTLSGRVGAYTEWFASFPTTGGHAGVSAAHALDGGFTVKLAPAVQFDVRLGVGLTGAADGFFAGSGIAFRY